MKTAQVLFGLGAAAAIGGAIYLSQKKKEEPTLGPQPTHSGSPPPPLPSYVPQELVNAYTKCYERGCTVEEYLQVQTALSGLMQQHPEALQVWTYFAEELAKRPPATFTQGPQLPTDFGVKMTYQPSVDQCYSYMCTYADVNQLLTNLQSVYFQHVLEHPNVAAGIGDVMRFLRDAYGLAQPGTQGRHTGGCSCQARQEIVGTGFCCDSCAKGEACEECGNHAPAVG